MSDRARNGFSALNSLLLALLIPAVGYLAKATVENGQQIGRLSEKITAKSESDVTMGLRLTELKQEQQLRFTEIKQEQQRQAIKLIELEVAIANIRQKP